ncbi:MAG: glycosyl transferase family 2 [Solirubrobacterales bacterium]|nr:glycosyl transferase family 2 [Solirubrobacterales bacterium]
MTPHPDPDPDRDPDPDLTVIVVTHEGRDLAVRALRSARDRSGAVRVQWLVVDSGSSDGTPDVIDQAFPDLRVERCANVGFAAANNIALRSARGRWVLLLNPDMEVVGGTLAELVAALDARAGVGAASVIQQWPDGRLQPTIRRDPSPGRQLGEALMLGRFAGEEESRLRRYEREQPADWLVGGFLVVRRAVIDAVGGLDERFFLFSEEADWCRRIRADGWDVRHLPIMRVIHHTGRSARPDLYAQNSHSKLLYARKHFTPRGRAAFHSALVLRHALRLTGLLPLALLRAAWRPRVQAERRALLVVIGLVAPPFTPLR